MANQAGTIVPISNPSHPAANSVRMRRMKHDLDAGLRGDPFGKKNHHAGSADVRGLTFQGRAVAPADLTRDGPREREAVHFPLLRRFFLVKRLQERFIIRGREPNEFDAVIVEVSLASCAHPNNPGLGFDHFWLGKNDEAKRPSQMERRRQLQAGAVFSQIFGPAHSG